MANSDNKPTRYAYSVQGTGRNERWIKLGAVFTHKDSKGETILLDALPLNFDGRITLRDIEVKETETVAEQ